MSFATRFVAFTATRVELEKMRIKRKEVKRIKSLDVKTIRSIEVKSNKQLQVGG